MANELWLPSRYTAPLAPEFPSQADNLIRFAELAWTTPESPRGLSLDDWQRWLLRSVLEVYPPGHPRAGELRYRQVVISLARQNGKSVIGSLLALWGLLMHVHGPYVLSIASSAEQARIVYDRVLYAIAQKPELQALFAKTTETRGIRTADGSGRYEVKAAKGAALQGLPNSLVIFDELHLSKPDMWSAVVQGQKTRTNGLVVGITTAGDESSQLLLSLYEQGQKSLNDPESRFGFFVWEGPEGCAVDDPAAIAAANPAIACGRIDIETVLSDIRSQPESDVRRYTLNQFVKGSGTPWLPPHLWHGCPTGQLPGKPSVVAVDVSPGAEWAWLTVGAKTDAGVAVEAVGALETPSVERLGAACQSIARRHRVTFVVESYQADLRRELERRGLPVESLSGARITAACSAAYSLIARGQVTHDGNQVVTDAMARGIRKNVGEHWRIVRPNTAVHLDPCMATVYAIYGAATLPAPGIRIG